MPSRRASTSPDRLRYARCRLIVGWGNCKPPWMWQTHTSPFPSSARIRSRVSSASARNTSASSAAPFMRGTGFVSQQEMTRKEPLDIFACTNIPCIQHIRSGEYIDAARGTPMSDVREIVKEKYGNVASRVRQGYENPSCCSSSGCGDPITSSLYDLEQIGTLPVEAVVASLGCGNPTALAELKAGETVLDLGSGGGIDVLLSARRVGPGGKAYGLDMTDEMLALARENQRKAGVTNVEFLKGEIENIPLPGASVDVLISNCVINLSADKRRVIAEAFRVLKPGGRLAVSDVVVRGEVPVAVRRSMELWVGCVAGALEEPEYRRLLADAGFEWIGVEPTRIYEFEDARAVLAGAGLDAEVLAREVGGRIMGAFVRARKPASV